MKLTDKEATSTTRVAVMGLPGTGKSTLVSKLASQYKLWWITPDNDCDILFKLPKKHQENVELFDLPDSANFPVAADTLLKLFQKKKGSICHKHGVYDCAVCKKDGSPLSSIDLTTMDPARDIVVLDTGSQLGASCLAHALRKHSLDYKPEWDDYGILRRWSEFFTSEWQAAQYNLIVVFHAIEAELEDKRKKLVPAFGSKDQSSKVGKAFSHIVYTDVVNGKHKAFSASTYSNSVMTKSRTDFEIEKLAEPSLAPVFAGLVPQTVQVDIVAQQKAATVDTPATKAVSSLEAMRARLNKGVK